ncbi:MAG: SUMF1/EgtB/PvdO family nonheme iron enzyme [Woronichinia naegeliana WA131]|uniref:SUMF1/EgtB/PvdO family nonheme iron enzyme n=1 Tax=Woronichinia naegeliana WA131 TaxID=2824559 RepID=A0A977PV09_9CYAN|nr:MAG: SUMF1/EgtB/PvdO family nonheme iron enzyme [Woronichinia naegeliana WA131]
MESPPVVSEFENLSEGDKTVSTKSSEPSERDQSFTVYRTSLSDQATVDDALGFTPYVTAIAEFLLNPDTEPPLTLSIEGEWGSGKSSFMKQLDKYLREKGQRTVWFNAWRHDKAESVWATFALSFIKQISTPKSWRDWPRILYGYFKLQFLRFNLEKGLFELIKSLPLMLFVVCTTIAIPLILAIYGVQGITELVKATNSQDVLWNRIQAAFKILFTVGGLTLSGTGVIAGIRSLFGNFQKLLNNPKNNLIKYIEAPDYKKQSAFIEEFHEDFGKIVDAYIGEGKVFVFIDDLDRCEHPKAADLMQAINLMIAEDPSVVFILGMDREKVAASLAVKYEQLLTYLPSEIQEIDPEILVQRKLDKGLAYGYSFIEKFVQLPFQVPQPSLTDFDRLFEQLTKSKSPSASTKITPTQRSFWTLPKLTWFKGKNQNLQTSQIPETIEQTTNLTAITQQLVQTEAKFLPTQTQKRLETIKVIFDQDSSTERDAIRMVAPIFDYNPRRIKQFLNLFRLKFYIAYLTGLFDRIEEGEGTMSQEPLTVFQLAKFTAISLKYPLLLLDLELDKSLLSTLYRYDLVGNRKNFDNVKGQGEFSSQEKNRLIYWLGHDKLRALLAYNVQENVKESESNQVSSQFSLANLNVQKLLQVSPQVIRQNQGLVVKNLSSLLAPDLQVVVDQILGQMVEIPGGSFLMGTDEAEVQRLNQKYSIEVFNRELPIHRVTLQKYFLGKYPVTQEQYQAVMGNNPSKFQDNPKNPVEQVSWQDAQAFCQKLRKLTGQDFRLPTEAEWEYACRAGTQTRYYFGDDESQLGDYAWYDENSDSKTHSVGHKKPNDWGLYDTHGNVWEWCEDSWHDSYANKPENIKNNGSIIWSDSNESYHVLRGGSWFINSGYCRSAFRYWYNADGRYISIGFRLVLSSF